ncbi:cytidylate kinase [Gigaspora margarita]|uniref:(d)CMP kinase n=1 Tax=Gigaspora margarita TaxID=4874 RepID=A0A8H3XJX0_GIGMA|nr:cytidylate kinase [Gigaspora margarita]
MSGVLLTDTEEINIAINSKTASGKTSVGKLIAEKLHYQFIDTGVFYRYLGFKFQSDNFKTNFYKIIDHLNNLKNENHLDEINTTVENFSKEEYFLSGKKAAILAENDKIREAINSILHEITKKKEFVVGFEASTTIRLR